MGIPARALDRDRARGDQQCLAQRERHAVLLSGVAPDLDDEPILVLCRGLETALTLQYRCHHRSGRP
jgi:hypothetical protein